MAYFYWFYLRKNIQSYRITQCKSQGLPIIKELCSVKVKFCKISVRVFCRLPSWLPFSGDEDFLYEVYIIYSPNSDNFNAGFFQFWIWFLMEMSLKILKPKIRICEIGKGLINDSKCIYSLQWYSWLLQLFINFSFQYALRRSVKQFFLKS